MAFWGVEVRPGKPFTHVHDEVRGRLRVCQATLGMGKGITRSVLQCNVGKKSPILICSLIPDKTETCHLELEFQEAEEVVLSVLGQRSVHLSGYYIGSGRGGGGDESDSYGEDIGEEDSENDERFYSEDEYESDFIDDGDIEMLPPSPRRKSGVVIEEIVDDDKPANGNGTRQQLKKKNQLSDTDDGEDDSDQLVVSTNPSLVIESEDEDGFPISTSLKKKNAVKNTEENKSGDNTVDDGRKRKIDAITDNVQSERETLPPDSSLQLLDNIATNDTLKKKKKVGEGKPLETTVSTGEALSTKLEQDVVDNNSEEKNEKDSSAGVEVQVTEKDGKSKKKKRDRAKKGKAQEGSADVSSTIMEETETEAAKEVKNADGMDQDQPLERELNEIKVGSNEKLKKKKKKKVRNDLAEGMSTDKDVEAGKDNKIVESLAHNELTKMVSDETDAAQPESKKKKRSKNPNKGLNSNQDLSDLVTAEEKAEPQKSRTFANGLVIEELSMGKPDGKKASPGSKVSVNYIGKLKNGKIFDSNVGARPFRFRLGIGEVIKGWDVGVAGMRMGDKRRLTIPPAMGYGAKGVGKIPANSWLVFDVELVDVE